MHAVGWQMIQAECRTGCETDWSAPLVSRAENLDDHSGARVRIHGTLTDQHRLVFHDGVAVAVQAPPEAASGRVLALGSVLPKGTTGPRLELLFAIEADDPP